MDIYDDIDGHNVKGLIRRVMGHLSWNSLLQEIDGAFVVASDVTIGLILELSRALIGTPIM